MLRMRISAEKILLILPDLVYGNTKRRNAIMQNRSYPHARELGIIHSCVTRKSSEAFENMWQYRSEASYSGKSKNSSHKKKRQAQ